MPVSNAGKAVVTAGPTTIVKVRGRKKVKTIKFSLLIGSHQCRGVQLRAATIKDCQATTMQKPERQYLLPFRDERRKEV
jgi:hypothetical protein